MLLKQVRTQQIHEMKKKEKEYVKLQVVYLYAHDYSMKGHPGQI